MAFVFFVVVVAYSATGSIARGHSSRVVVLLSIIELSSVA